MNNHHQHVICTVKASYLEWYVLAYVWSTSIATGWLRSLVTKRLESKQAMNGCFTQQSMNNKYQHVISTV